MSPTPASRSSARPGSGGSPRTGCCRARNGAPPSMTEPGRSTRGRRRAPARRPCTPATWTGRTPGSGGARGRPAAWVSRRTSWWPGCRRSSSTSAPRRRRCYPSAGGRGAARCTSW
ncbi:hypothetical protein EE612_012528 [Oryza sativa]|nr:hypothetical protein EE612_012528 [Oryza sativa]